MFPVFPISSLLGLCPSVWVGEIGEPSLTRDRKDISSLEHCKKIETTITFTASGLGKCFCFDTKISSFHQFIL
jgi:hypothetical protein